MSDQLCGALGRFATNSVASNRPNVGALTVVMYHYVRPPARRPVDQVNSLPLADFVVQIEHIARRYHVVGVAEIVNAIRTGEALPPKSLLLTFDDGYRDHLAHVLPVLGRHRIHAAFFPVASAAQHGTLLDVNRVHFVLAAGRDRQSLVEEIDHYVRAWQAEFGLDRPEQYRARWARPGRFDDVATTYIKRMLQVALPYEARRRLASVLFRKYVTSDEVTFARELYMDVHDLRLLQDAGMYIGSHGSTHEWLDALPEAAQETDIDESLAFLRAVGSPVESYWAIAYPYGGYDTSLLAALRARDCALGFTTECRIADLIVDDPLRVPRLDTNDFPFEASGAIEDGRAPGLER